MKHEIFTRWNNYDFYFISEILLSSLIKKKDKIERDYERIGRTIIQFNT